MAVITVCPSCGRHYEQATRFCGSCGALMGDGAVSSEDEPTVATPVLPTTEELARSFNQPSAQNPTATSADTQQFPIAPPTLVPAAPPPSPPMVAPQPAGQGAAAPPPKRSDRGMLISLGLAGCVILIALGVALYVGGVFSGTGGSNPASTTTGPGASSGSSNPTTVAPASPATPTPGATTPNQTKTAHGTGRGTQTVGTAPNVLTGSAVTGQDPSGMNTGPGCSDNPSSSLPGCNDSPTAPNGGAHEGPCANGITIDSATTSCSLAEQVRSAYSSDGQVSVTSGGSVYHFLCQTGGRGTTGYTFCESNTSSGTLYLRWHG
jgi:hypothetical protein